MPCAKVAIKPACGAESWRIAKSDPASLNVGFMQQHQRPIHDQTGHDDRNEFGHLNFARRAAEDISNFEILQQLASHCGRDANHGCYSQHRCYAGVSRNPQANHEKCRD